MHTVLIIDDHTLLRETWAHLINQNPDYTVAGSVGSAEEALVQAKELQPQIILLDINLPGISGLQATPLLLQAAPQTKIIGVSMHNQPTYVKQMLRSGAVGYVTKSSRTAELFEAFKEALAGRKYLCEEIKNIIAEQLGTDETKAALSERELSIIRLLKEGMSSKEIAAQLAIATKTVDVHRYNILKKLKLRNTAALVQYISNHPELIMNS